MTEEKNTVKGFINSFDKNTLIATGITIAVMRLTPGIFVLGAGLLMINEIKDYLDTQK